MKNFLLDIKKAKTFFLILLAWLFVVGIYQATKKMPQNTDFRGAKREIYVEDIQFLYDLTYKNAKGELTSEQMIFDEIFSLIEAARDYFDKIWNNRDGNHYTVSYEAYKDESILKIQKKSSLVLSKHKRHREKKNSVLLFFGRVWSKVTKSVGSGDNYEVKTANAVCGVGGT